MSASDGQAAPDHGPPLAVCLADWIAQLGKGAPEIGAIVACANCLASVTAAPGSFLMPRPAHNDAVLVCDDCARPYVSQTVPFHADGTLAGTGSTSEAANAPSDALDTAVVVGTLQLDAQMLGSLKIAGPEDVQRILTRLDQVVAQAEAVLTQGSALPTVLLGVLDFLSGRASSCTLLHVPTQARSSGSAPAPGEVMTSSGFGYLLLSVIEPGQLRDDRLIEYTLTTRATLDRLQKEIEHRHLSLVPAAASNPAPEGP